MGITMAIDQPVDPGEPQSQERQGNILTDLNVMFISLVSLPANGKPLVLKSGRHGKVFTLKATNEEMQRTYGIVYAPNEIDSQGDMADAVTILKAANEYMRDGRTQNVDVEHSFQPEQSYVAESWIVRKGDPLFPTEPEGSWAVGIQVEDSSLWERLKKGELTGLSLAGEAKRETEMQQEQPQTPPQTPVLSAQTDLATIEKVATEMIKAAFLAAIANNQPQTQLGPQESAGNASKKTVQDSTQEIAAALKKGGVATEPPPPQSVIDSQLWGLA